MTGLGEQIAVLDGLAALDPHDGRIGQVRARVNQYARQVAANMLRRNDVIDPSEGANYGGGSSYARRLPLLPSTIGLAGMPSVLPDRRNVIDPSGGANYGGGSDWAPGLPLLPSNAGLASALIEGGYGRAGLGASIINGGYGRAGLGSTGTAVDEDLAAAAEAVEVARRLDPNDGRIGQQRAMTDEYGKRVMPGVLARSNVIDPSEGANYGGGSTYYPGGPLTPSNAGLAGCMSCGGGFAAPLTPLTKQIAARALISKQIADHMRRAMAAKTRATAARDPLQKEEALVSMYQHLYFACTLERKRNPKMPAKKCDFYKRMTIVHIKRANVLVQRRRQLAAVRTPAGTEMWR